MAQQNPFVMAVVTFKSVFLWEVEGAARRGEQTVSQLVLIIAAL